MCGGAHRTLGLVCFEQGLSPRVRGSPWTGTTGCGRQGSIPACAGEPYPQGSSEPSGRVYPRVCGGAPCIFNFVNRALGLSPRVRGSRKPHLKPRVEEGSIPACAGEPWAAVRSADGDLVYPRVCGGAEDSEGTQVDRTGLSPRVRGSPARRCPSRGRCGSIPACAGEPLKLDHSSPSAGVYPRVCGGASLSFQVSVVARGLSPRVRGSLDRGL